jgi:Tol biopolymer transport system component
MVFLLLLLLAPSLQSRQETSFGPGEEPVFNREGNKIAFVRSGSIWTIEIRTRKAKSIVPSGDNHFPSWSPDGTVITYGSLRATKDWVQFFSIWKVDSDGSHPVQLTNTDSTSTIDDQIPRWTRDGLQIAWTHGNQIWTMNTDGSHPHPLTVRRGVTYEYACDFSPDGKQLVYVANDDESSTYRIRTLSILDRKQAIFSNGVVALGVRWSADGKYLYYNTGAELMKVRADGSEQAISVYRFQPGLEIHSFDISSDDQHIVYDDSGAERDGNIYIGNLH